MIKESIKQQIRKYKRLIACITTAAIVITSTVVSTPCEVKAASSKTRIHYVTINDNTNAIIVECDGHFGVIDSGEDTDYPDGSDSRYPARPGIVKWGFEDQVIDYMYSIGVNTKNLDFYIGTHPHSDHIGSADEVIREFRPKRVYIGEYSDSMLYNSSGLWDNQYVYDTMIQAAKDVGATIIQNFSKQAKVTKLSSDAVYEDGDIDDFDSEIYDRDYVMISWSGDNGIDINRPSSIKVDIQRRVSTGGDTSNIEAAISNRASTDDDNENEIVSSDEGIMLEAESEEYVEETISEDEEKTVEEIVEEDALANDETLENDSADDDLLSEDEAEALEELDEEAVSTEGYEEEEVVLEESFAVNDISLEAQSLSKGTLLDDGLWETIKSINLTPNDRGQWEQEAGIQIENGYEYRLVCDNIPNYSIDIDNSKFIIYAKYLNGDLGGSEDGSSLATEDGAFEIGEASFMLGEGMKISIMNTGVDRYRGWNDANDFSWGVLVEANGMRAFCGGDINNYNGHEDKLLDKLGRVDLLTLGHHGYRGSSSRGYVKGLNPSKIVLCSVFKYIDSGVFDTLVSMGKKGSEIYATGSYSGKVPALVFNFDSGMTNNVPSIYTFGGANPDSIDYKAMLLKGGRLDNSVSKFVTCNGVKKFFDKSYLAAKSKWVSQGGKRYYINAKGDPVTGWHKVKGLWYYHKKSGAAYTSKWYNEDGKWYYFKKNSSMKTGWLKLGSKWYYFNKNGIMQTGWQKLGGDWYYLKTDGVMAKGWLKLDGKWYYFSKKSGKLAKNTWVGDYYVDDKGVWTDSR